MTVDRGQEFAPLSASSTALLTMFRRTGEPVATPVSIALRGGRAYSYRLRRKTMHLYEVTPDREPGTDA